MNEQIDGEVFGELLEVKPVLNEGSLVHYVMPDGKEHRPAIVVKVWRYRGTDSESGPVFLVPENGVCQLQVFSDGSNDLYHLTAEGGTEYGIDRDQVKHGHFWRTSVLYSEDPKPNTWHWPE